MFLNKKIDFFKLQYTYTMKFYHAVKINEHKRGHKEGSTYLF